MSISIFMFAVSFVTALIWEFLTLKEFYFKCKSPGSMYLRITFWFLITLFFGVLGLYFKKESDKLLLDVLIMIEAVMFIVLALIFALLIYRKYKFNPFKSKL